jgi:ferric-dicitrate binding protein FerR (iron transport regulator)
MAPKGAARKGLSAVASSLLVTVAAVPASADDKIGVAAAVLPDVSGVLAGATRALAAGSEVFSDEMIRTGQSGTAQLLFLDETTLSIGPRSEVTLDRFVYDPGSQTGEMVVRATGGVLRFISGTQSAGAYRVETPVATIGFRGTIGEVGWVKDMQYVKCEDGIVTVTVAGKTYELHPGEGLLIDQNANVYGPFSWDGSIVTAIGNVSFPLEGTNFLDDPRRFETEGETLDLTDQLEAVDKAGEVGDEGDYGS